MLHGSETWSLKRENELALHQAEIRMITWMCGVKLRDKQQLAVEDKVKVIQRNKTAMVWTCYKKDDDDWVKKCVTFEVEGARQRGRPRKTWKELWTRMRMIWTQN